MLSFHDGYLVNVFCQEGRKYPGIRGQIERRRIVLYRSFGIA